MRRAAYVVGLRKSAVGALGGAVGGLVGTAVMVGLLLLELTISGTPGGSASTAFALAFGGPSAGIPTNAPYAGLSIHLWHGVVIGGAMGAVLGTWGWFVQRRPTGVAGIGALLGAALGGVVLAILAGPGAVTLTALLTTFVLSIHAVFGVAVAVGAWGFSRRFGTALAELPSRTGTHQADAHGPGISPP